MNDKIILVSGNAGQGKTTVAANIATVLSMYCPRVILVDSDLLTPKLSYHFGVLKPKRTLQQVLQNGVNLKDAAYSHPAGLEIIFSGSGSGAAHPSVALKDLETANAITIVDVPFYDLKWYGTGYPTVLVTEPDLPSVVELTKMAQKIPNVKGVIVNKAQGDKTELSPGNIAEFTNHAVLGVVPFEQKMKEALKNGYPIVDWEPESKISHMLREIAANLINQQYKTLANGTSPLIQKH
ncbi:hypothetical protein KY329_04195 [Candidatus Woesearchaeota archaeon]|nr:hypothetical protein [Candidatus Woesearchaeota archaeon]